MGQIIEPLQAAGFEGTELISGDGVTHCCHPIFTIFVGDYPEQVLATGVKTGECPGCECPREELEGEDEYEYHNLADILEALAACM